MEENEVSMARIDDAVRRVLRLKVRLGLFEQPITPMADYPLLGSEEHAQLALKGGRGIGNSVEKIKIRFFR